MANFQYPMAEVARDKSERLRLARAIRPRLLSGPAGAILGAIPARLKSWRTRVSYHAPVTATPERRFGKIHGGVTMGETAAVRTGQEVGSCGIVPWESRRLHRAAFLFGDVSRRLRARTNLRGDRPRLLPGAIIEDHVVLACGRNGDGKGQPPLQAAAEERLTLL